MGPSHGGPSRDHVRTRVLYLDPRAPRRSRARRTLEAATDHVTVVPAEDEADALATARPVHGAVVVVDPPEVDRETLSSVVESVSDRAPVVVRAPVGQLGECAEWSGVTDHYLQAEADDRRVAERIADATTLSGTDQHWQTIVDRMADAFFAVDDEWRLTYVNDRASRILAEAMDRPDGTPAELEGLELWAEIPEAVDTPFYDAYTEAMETQEPVTFEAYYEPMEVWFEARAFPSPSGLSVYFQDVTEQVRQREALKSRDRTLREVYDRVSDLELSFAEQVSALLSIGRDELGTDHAALSSIDGEEYVFEVVDSASSGLSAGDTVDLSSTYCERAVSDQRTVVIEDASKGDPDLRDRAGYTEWGVTCYIGAPVHLDGEIYGTLCFYDETPREEPFSEWEITFVDLLAQWVSYELDRTETSKRLQEKNERLEQFATIVGHDLRNPLEVASTRLRLADDEYESEHFEAIERAHGRMSELIDNLLSLARGDTGELETEPVYLPVVARDAWSQVDTGDATLTVGTDRVVRAEAGQLQRVLENLFRNAVEHGAASSRPADGVTVTVGDIDDGFVVADDGPGLPPGGDVFELGFSTDPGGTGLGLAIVEQTAATHGWSVTAGESEDGGARFAFHCTDQ